MEYLNRLLEILEQNTKEGVYIEGARNLKHLKDALDNNCHLTNLQLKETIVDLNQDNDNLIILNDELQKSIEEYRSTIVNQAVHIARCEKNELKATELLKNKKIQYKNEIEKLTKENATLKKNNKNNIDKNKKLRQELKDNIMPNIYQSAINDYSNDNIEIELEAISSFFFDWDNIDFTNYETKLLKDTEFKEDLKKNISRVKLYEMQDFTNTINGLQEIIQYLKKFDITLIDTLTNNIVLIPKFIKKYEFDIDIDFDINNWSKI